MKNRKPPTEKEAMSWLESGRLELPPLRFELAKTQPSYRSDREWDFEIKARWADETVTFAVEYKSLSTPKVFEETLRRCKGTWLPARCLPLMLMPYLKPDQLDELEKSGISGVDLCGNGVVIVPDRLRVFRSGNRNQFASYAPIKNIYRKNTSMVGRVFFANPSFPSIQSICDAVNARNPLVTKWGRTPMQISTVSKAIKGLEDDLVVDRAEGIRLIQADTLLSKLSENYELPRSVRRVRLKVEADQPTLIRLLQTQAEAATLLIMATGLSSVNRYAVMQRDDVLSVYCSRLEPLMERFPGRETNRFANLELVETDEQPMYFDSQDDHGFLWASPLQTYLELMSGDKRDRETAEQVKAKLLRQAGGVER